MFSVLGKLGAADAKALGMPTHPQASHHAERVVLLYIDSLLVNTMEEIRMCDDPVAFLRVLQVCMGVGCVRVVCGVERVLWRGCCGEDAVEGLL